MMDMNNYSFAPTMLDGEPEKEQNMEKCFDCAYFETCGWMLRECAEQNGGQAK